LLYFIGVILSFSEILEIVETPILGSDYLRYNSYYF
jgi:hypothetical protein